ncbi:hypothetical protein IJ182_00830 [bacterium]|nr:hypothetical protein [bacterium]
MNTEELSSNDKIEKIKKLLAGINNVRSTVDLYSFCIKNTQKDGIKG